MNNIEENYFIDTDLSDDNNSVVIVYKQCGSSVKLVNSFTGDNAKTFHKLLTGEILLGKDTI